MSTIQNPSSAVASTARNVRSLSRSASPASRSRVTSRAARIALLTVPPTTTGARWAEYHRSAPNAPAPRASNDAGSRSAKTCRSAARITAWNSGAAQVVKSHPTKRSGGTPSGPRFMYSMRPPASSSAIRSGALPVTLFIRASDSRSASSARCSRSR